MAKGNFAQKKEKKKPKKKQFFGKRNATITKEKAMYDNQLVGISNYGLSRGF
jgi:hypothetical protein